MLPLLAIPIVAETAQTHAGFLNSAFFARPVDVILFDILLWFGWIPIFFTICWGFLQMWVNHRQGLYSKKQQHMLLAIDVPSQTEQTPKALENLFANIYGCKSSITWKEKWIGGRFHPSFSFEIVSSEGYIQFFIRTQKRFRDIIEAGIYAHYPDAEISEVEDYTKKFPHHFPNDTYEMWGGEMTLEGKSYLPIRTYADFEDSMTQEIKDPLGYTLEQMAKMRPGEHFWIQYVVQPSSNDWVKDGVRRINELYGIADKKKKGFIEEAVGTALGFPSGLLQHATNFDLLGALFGSHASPEADPFKAFKLSIRDIEEAKAILKKTAKVALGTKIRILYVAKKEVYAKVERTGMVKGILNQFSNLNLNKFALHIPSVPKDDYFWMRWEYTTKQNTLMHAYCSRSFGVGAEGKFLNAEELATLWHFPTITMKAPLIKKSESKRAEPPVGLPFTFEENILPGWGEEASRMSGLATPPPMPDHSDVHHDDHDHSGGDDHDDHGSHGAPAPKKRSPAPVYHDSDVPDLSGISAPLDPHDQMPPDDLLPSVKRPTDEDDDFVPPNLPT